MPMSCTSGPNRWSIQSPPMSPFIVRAYMHGWGHVTGGQGVEDVIL
jgi:hypothetical protein